MYVIDKENKKIIITKDRTREVIEIKEDESIERKFLEGTQDKYECVLKIIDVDKYDEKTKEVIGTETKAFAMRKGNPNWLIPFEEEEYNI